ncbi:hypothetical protein VNO80_19651 [Phaseolus coccineus]|uniref:Uncharacterized protein n=1 Tax=Phaseolus coccineus TaxID=3886 RepID=A0AAN9MGU0_PHACN
MLRKFKNKENEQNAEEVPVEEVVVTHCLHPPKVEKKKHKRKESPKLAEPSLKRLRHGTSGAGSSIVMSFLSVKLPKAEAKLEEKEKTVEADIKSFELELSNITLSHFEERVVKLMVEKKGSREVKILRLSSSLDPRRDHTSGLKGNSSVVLKGLVDVFIA